MHAKMKKNRDKLNDQFKQKLDDFQSKIKVLQVCDSKLGQNKSRIVLPKIRDKIGLQKFDGIENFQYHNIKSSKNATSDSKQILPGLSLINKNSNEAIPNENYIKYKSLLQRSDIATDRNYGLKQSQIRLQTSSSSQNMSVQEIIKEKIYGSHEKEPRKYL